MDNLNLASRLVSMDWNSLFQMYGAIFASFCCAVAMFNFLLLDEVLQEWDGYMAEEWEGAVGQVSLHLPLLAVVPKRFFYRNEKEYVAFCDELAFWPQEERKQTETWDWPGTWVMDGLVDMTDSEDRPVIDHLSVYDEFIVFECLEA